VASADGRREAGRPVFARHGICRTDLPCPTADLRPGRLPGYSGRPTFLGRSGGGRAGPELRARCPTGAALRGPCRHGKSRASLPHDAGGGRFYRKTTLAGPWGWRRPRFAKRPPDGGPRGGRRAGPTDRTRDRRHAGGGHGGGTMPAGEAAGTERRQDGAPAFSRSGIGLPALAFIIVPRFLIAEGWAAYYSAARWRLSAGRQAKPAAVLRGGGTSQGHPPRAGRPPSARPQRANGTAARPFGRRAGWRRPGSGCHGYQQGGRRAAGHKQKAKAGGRCERKSCRASATLLLSLERDPRWSLLV